MSASTSTHLINAAAEIKAIRTILLSPNAEVRSSCLGRLDPTYFGYPPLLKAYRKLIELLQYVENLPSLKVFLSDADIAADEQLPTLLSDVEYSVVDTMDDLEHLMHQLDQARQFRALNLASLGINKQLSKPEAKVEVITALVEQALLEVRSNQAQSTQMYHSGSQNNSDDVFREMLDPDTSGTCIPSGFYNFDSRTGGFRRGDLIVIASHYKGGKSIMKLNMLLKQYAKCLNVCDVTLEMSVMEEMQRLGANLSGVPFEKIYRHKQEPMSFGEAERLTAAWKRHKDFGQNNNCRFTIWPAAAINPTQLELSLKPFAFDVIAIDYVNLFTPDAGSGGRPGQVDAQQLSTWNKSLKRMAKSLNCVVVALTQLDKTTGNIRYSRSALEDANNVWSWKYGEAQAVHHVIKVEQLAARSSQPFSFYLKENFAHMEITDHDGEFFDDEEEQPEEEKSTYKGKRPWKK